MNLHIQHKHVESIAILISCLVVATILPTLIVVVLPYIFYKLVVLIPLRHIGVLTRSVLVLLTLLCLNTMIGFGAWVLGIPITISIIILLYGVLVSLLIVFTPLSANKSSSQVLLQGREVFGLIIAVAIFIVIALPLTTRHYETANPVIPVQLISYGGDNISHIALLKAVDLSQGYAQDYPNKLSDTLNARYIPYPQGWHLNLSILKSFIEIFSDTFSTKQFLIFYYLASGLGMSLLAYMFIILGMSIQESLKTSNRFAGYLSIGTMAAILFMGPIFTFFALGFQTLIVAMLLFLAELFLLLELLNQKNRSTQKQITYLSIVIATGISYVWFFLWPVAVATVVLFVVSNFRLYSRTSYAENAKFIVACSALGAVGLGQLFFQVVFGPDSPTVNNTGLTLEPNNFVLLSFALIVFVFVVYLYENARVRYIGHVAFISAVFALVILAYQLITVGEPRYYYFKATYTFIILGVMIIGATLSVALSNIFRGKGLGRGKVVLLCASLTVAMISISFTLSSKEFRLYLEQKPYGISAELANAVLNFAATDSKLSHRVVAIGSCNREDDIVAMRFAETLLNNPTDTTQDVAIAQLTSPYYPRTFSSIKNSMGSKGLLVISSDYPAEQKLKQFLGSDAGRVDFIDLDNARTPKPSSACPNLLH